MNRSSSFVVTSGIGTALLLLTAGNGADASTIPQKFSQNGHFYQYVLASDSVLTWDQSFAAASASSYLGHQGYLATITSKDEQAFIEGILGSFTFEGSYVDFAIGGSDRSVEGEWRWVNGPEAGTQFWSGATSGSPVNGSFAYWETLWGSYRQPDNAGGENVLSIQINNTPGSFPSDQRYMWNDLPDGWQMAGYVVEYGSEPSEVPVPGTLGLMCLGLSSVTIFRRKWPSK